MLMSLSALASAPNEDVGRDLRRLAILGGDGEGIESRIFAGGLVAGRKRHLDLHERHVADDVAVADARYRRHVHAPPVLGAGDLARHRKARGLGVFAGLAVIGGSRQLHDLGRRGELLAAVKGGQQRHAHKDGRGHAGQERAGKPACRNLPLVGRSGCGRPQAAAARCRVRLWFPRFRSFRKATSSPTRPRLFMFVAATIACREGRSQRRQDAVRRICPLHSPPTSARAARPLGGALESSAGNGAGNRAPLWRGR